jgi:hypothetical protein
VEGKLGTGATETSNEVVYESADGTFNSVAAVDMGRSQLEVNALGLNEGL